MPKNSNLHNAKVLKRDQFYTCRSTVEDELWHYTKHFKNKTILCNCDDDEYSEFFKYFQKRFEVLGLKKLIGTHFESEKGKPSYKLELYRDTNNDGQVTWKDEVIKTPIYGDDKYTAGDFRSKDCIELLKEADIVVTNPPFSLFREDFSQLIKFKKNFLILGNINFVGCKEIFPFFKDNEISLGISIHSGDREFYVPQDYSVEFASSNRIEKDGKKCVRIKGVRWFTNIKTEYRQPPLQLVGNYYSPEEYPKYDNYDAINVDKVANIPCDYPGIMGVPLTFMDKYCSEQFEIVGLLNVPETLDGANRIGEKWIETYRRQGGKGHYTPNMKCPVSFINGKAITHYNRIFIQNKHPEESKYRESNIKKHVLNKVFDTGIAFKVLQKAA